MELVIASQFLGNDAGILLEHDETADKIEEPPLLEYAFYQGFQLRGRKGVNILALDCPPRGESFPVRRQSANFSLVPIGNDQHGVAGEKAGHLGFVGLELVVGTTDSSLVVGGVL